MASRTINADRLLAELAFCSEEPSIPGLPTTLKSEDIKDYDLAVMYKRLTFALEDYVRMRSALVSLAATVTRDQYDSKSENDRTSRQDLQV